MVRSVPQRHAQRTDYSETPWSASWSDCEWSDTVGWRPSSQWQRDWDQSADLHDMKQHQRMLFVAIPCVMLLVTGVFILNALVQIAQAISFIVEWICIFLLVTFLVSLLLHVVTDLPKDTPTESFDYKSDNDEDDRNDGSHSHHQASDLSSHRSHAMQNRGSNDLNISHNNNDDLDMAESPRTQKHARTRGSNTMATVRAAQATDNGGHSLMGPTPAELEAIETEAKLDAIRADEPGMRD